MTNPQISEPSSDDKLWSGLSYVGLVCCMIPCLVIFLLKKDESAYIKFQSLQALGVGLAIIGVSLVLGLVLGIIGLIPIIGPIIGVIAPGILSLAVFAGWIYLMIMAFTGKPVRIPYLADFIEQNLMG